MLQLPAIALFFWRSDDRWESESWPDRRSSRIAACGERVVEGVVEGVEGVVLVGERR